MLKAKEIQIYSDKHNGNLCSNNLEKNTNPSTIPQIDPNSFDSTSKVM